MSRLPAGAESARHPTGHRDHPGALHPGGTTVRPGDPDVRFVHAPGLGHHVADQRPVDPPQPGTQRGLGAGRRRGRTGTSSARSSSGTAAGSS